MSKISPLFQRSLDGANTIYKSILCLSGFRIQPDSSNNFDCCPHFIMHGLHVGKRVNALLVKHPRHAISANVNASRW